MPLDPKVYREKAVAKRLGRLLEGSELLANCRRVVGRFEGGRPIGETCDLIEGVGVGQTAKIE
jgi:hypothetical protein